jgi:hypothetical protein
MSRAIPAIATAVCCAVFTSSAHADSPRSPLHGTLQPGRHGVGFTVLKLSDPSRPVRADRDSSGAPVAMVDRARAIDVHVWYPAIASASPRLTVREYAVAHLPAGDATATDERLAGLRRFLGQFGTMADDAWSGLLTTPLLAVREAPRATGRFPLVIGQLRPFSTTVTSEYLASHGYVVAMTHSQGGPEPAGAGAGLEVAVRDMELAIVALRARPDVDQAALAALGFSGAGFSQILLAMRHPDVDAVCDLESAIFDDRMMWPLSRAWGYDLAAMRVPFLHTYSVPLAKRENRLADFEAMRYSARHHYLVDAPQIHHWDFATEGMAASVLRLRGDASTRLQQVFETTNRYVLAFFNAYVKGDQQELAFLRRDPAANGAPPGLATIRALPATVPAPTLDEIFTAITARGVEAAMTEFEAARARDPESSTFREAEINRLGYRLLRSQRPADALTIFRRNTVLYPASSNALDSLAEALETTGDRAGAIETTRKALEVLARQDLTDQQRADMRALLEARLRRLAD